MSPTVSCWLCVTVSLVPLNCCMSLTVSYGCWLSHIVCPVEWSCCMSITVSFGCWLSLTVSPTAMELLHISKCLPWLRAFTHCLTCLMKELHVSLCLLYLPAGSHCVSQCHGVAACLPLSPLVAHCLSLSLPVLRRDCMCLTVSYGCWISLTISPITWSYYMSLTVFHGCWLFLTVSLIPWSCYMSHIVAGWLSLSLLVPYSTCVSLTFSSRSM